MSYLCAPSSGPTRDQTSHTIAFICRLEEISSHMSKIVKIPVMCNDNLVIFSRINGCLFLATRIFVSHVLGFKLITQLSREFLWLQRQVRTICCRC